MDIVPENTAPPQPSKLNIFSWKGRIGRSRFLTLVVIDSVVANLISIGMTVLIGSWVSGTGGSGLIVLVLGSSFIGFVIYPLLLLFLLSFPITKRFHDINKSGQYFWALLIPIFDIYLALELLLERGGEAANQYGPNPLSSERPTGDFFDGLGKNTTFKIVATILLSAGLMLFIHASRPFSENSSVVQTNGTAPVLIDGRGVVLSGLQVNGDQMIWYSSGNLPHDDVFLFTPDFSVKTEKVIQVSDLSHARSPAIYDDALGGGWVFWIQDANLYGYNIQKATSALLLNNIGKIYGFDPGSGRLILGGGVLSFVPPPPVMYGNWITMYYNPTTGASGEISMPDSHLIGNAEYAKVILRNNLLCYGSSASDTIIEDNIDTGESQIFSITPESSKNYAGFPIKLVDCNADYIAYSYEPVQGSGSETYSVGLYDTTHKKIVLEKNIASGNDILGEFVGDELYYSGDPYLAGNITIHSINLNSLKDSSVISIPNFISCGNDNGWGIGNGYIAYQGVNVSAAGGSCGADLYIKKISLPN